MKGQRDGPAVKTDGCLMTRTGVQVLAAHYTAHKLPSHTCAYMLTQKKVCAYTSMCMYTQKWVCAYTHMFMYKHIEIATCIHMNK